MVALQIRDVPLEIRDALTAEAQRRELSLQTYLLDVLTSEASSLRTRAWVDRRRRAATSRLGGVSTERILAAVAEARSSRDA